MTIDEINTKINAYTEKNGINKKTEKKIMEEISKITPNQERKYGEIVKCYKKLFDVMSKKRQAERDKNEKFKSCFLDKYNSEDTLTKILEYKTGFGSSFGSMQGKIKDQMETYEGAYLSTLERLNNLVSKLKDKDVGWIEETLLLLKCKETYWRLETNMTEKEMILCEEEIAEKLKNLQYNLDEIKKYFKYDTSEALIEYTEDWKKEKTTIKIYKQNLKQNTLKSGKKKNQ